MGKSRLEKLQEQRDNIEQRIKALRTKESAQRRKAETRRKIIAGALALEHAEKNPDSAFAKKLAALLNEYVTKPKERELMGLPSSNDNLRKNFTDKSPATAEQA